MTPKQLFALRDAEASEGSLFQVPENPRHQPRVLASLVEQGMLQRARVGTVWTLTPRGREALANMRAALPQARHVL